MIDEVRPYRNVSDHQMLIARTELPTTLTNEAKERITQSKSIIAENNRILESMLSGKGVIADFQDPNVKKELKERSDEGLDIDNIEEWQNIRKTGRDTYEERNRKNMNELEQIMEGRAGKPLDWDKVTTLLQIKNKAKPYNKDENFDNIVEGFRKHVGYTGDERNIDNAGSAIKTIMDRLEVTQDFMKEQRPIWKPKSKARDMSGFSQRRF